MSTLNEKLTRINTAKNNIKTSIQNKLGVTFDSSVGFEDYASKIDSIESKDGSITMYNGMKFSNWTFSDLNNHPIKFASGFNDGSYLFKNCYYSYYKSLVDNIDLSKITNIYQMFGNFIGSNYDCYETLDLSDKTFYSIGELMFENLQNFTKVDLSNTTILNTSPTNCNYLFQNSSSLKEIDFTGMTNNQTTTSYWGCFSGCKLLEKINHIENFLKLEYATELSYMFQCMDMLETIDLSNCNSQGTNNINFSMLFTSDYTLKSIDLSKFNFQYLSNYNDLFNGCYSLKTITLPSGYPTCDMYFEYSYLDYDTIKGILTKYSNTNASGNVYFNSSQYVKDVDGELQSLITTITSQGRSVMNLNIVTSDDNLPVIVSKQSNIYLYYKTESGDIGFSSYSNIVTRDNINNLNNQGYEIYLIKIEYCYTLQYIDMDFISSNTKITSFEDMFMNSYLHTIDCNSLFGTSLKDKITTTEGMFYNLSELRKVTLPQIGNQLTDMRNMFYYTTNLQELDLSPIDTSNVTSMNNTFYCCGNNVSCKFDFSQNDFSNVTDFTCWMESTNAYYVKFNPNKPINASFSIELGNSIGMRPYYVDMLTSMSLTTNNDTKNYTSNLQIQILDTTENRNLYQTCLDKGWTFNVDPYFYTE